MFSNALSQALSAAGTGTGGGGGPALTQSTSAHMNPPAPSVPSSLNLPESNENLTDRYATELRTMQEMGLFEELINIQALVISNGDVEAAINLVLTGFGNFN